MKKALALILTFVLLVCTIPTQIITFAEGNLTEVIIINEEDGTTHTRYTSVSQEKVMVGSYALKSSSAKDGFLASQYMWDSTDYFDPANVTSVLGNSKNGALRFWIYVEDISTISEFKMQSSNSFVRFGTKDRKTDGTAEANPDKSNFFYWSSWIDQITDSGWNEVVLKFSNAKISGKEASINLEKIDFFVISFPNLQTSGIITYIDNIKVSTNTEVTPEPQDVVIVDDEADERIGLTTVTDAKAKIGIKSLVSSTNNTAIAYAGFWGADAISTKNIVDVTANGKSGALRFWFYVEDISSLKPMKDLSTGSYVKIGSGKNPDNNLYYWGSWVDQVTKSGWNEVVLRFSEAKKSGTPELDKVNTIYFKFPDNTPKVTVYVDDIRVSADTKPSTEVDLPIYLSNGTKATAGVKTLSKNGFEAVDASKVENPYLKIEIYVARGDDATADVNGFLKNSLIELNSSGTIDNNEVQWRWENGLRLEPGWNVRYLPLSQAKETGTFDITNIKGFRYYQNVSDTSVAFQLKVKNLSIVPHTDVPEYNFDIDKSLTGKTSGQNVYKNLNATNQHGYTEGIGSIDASNLENPYLKLSVYIARDDDTSSIAGLLKSGMIELTSSAKCDVAEIAWNWATLDITPGWNTLYLPFSKARYTDGGSKFDIKAINYFRIFHNPTDTTVSYTLEVKDVSIINREDSYEIDGIYGNGMLFQQNKEVVITGNGRAYDTVDVAIVNQEGTVLQSSQTTVDADGRFTATLNGLAGGYDEYDITFTVDGKTVAALENVVFGELWLASGQSNMEYSMSATPSAAEILKNPTDKFIKILLVPSYSDTADFPYEPIGNDVSATWGDGTQASVIGSCSAVGYYHAAELREQLGMPIGIIDANKGATNIYGWLSRETIESDVTVLANAKADGCYTSESNWNSGSGKYLQMSAMYNTKISPLSNFSIAGMIWYQGCGNINNAEGHYAAALELLLKSYSEFFGFEENSMPMIVSHLHPYFNSSNFEIAARFNNEFSAVASKYPENVAQIAIYDLPLEYASNNQPIHPTEKIDIGKRFGIAAAGLVYDKNNTFTSPSFESATTQDGAMLVKFKNLGDTILAAKNGTALEGFAVAGADGVYMPAKAEIVSKDTVKVWNISITNPVAVTYGYSQMNNTSNLVSVDENGEVLFAVVPFCSIKIDGEQIYRPVYWLSTETLTQWRNISGSSAGWYEIWNTDSEATTISLDKSNKTDGASSLKIAHTTNEFWIKPNIHLEGTTVFRDIDTSLIRYGRLIFDIKTANEITLNITADKTYTIKASDKWQRFTVDLSEINDMSELTFAFASVSGCGEVYIDNFSLLANVTDGDINNDSNVNGSDLVLLRKSLLGCISEIGVTDVNKDGYTDIIDLVRLKKILIS